MEPFPDTPRLEEADPLSGHLWVREHVDGGPLRFAVERSGLVVFGDRERAFEEAPPGYRAAVRHVREALDRGALRRAAEDPSAVTFFGVATRRQAVDYDWDRTPPFLGVDVWSPARGAYLPPDGAHRVFDRLGLDPVATVAKEVDARHSDPASLPFGESAYYDGPVAGLLLGDKTGGRALLPNPDVPADPPPATADTAEEVAAAWATPDRVDRAAAAAGTATVDAVTDRLFERGVRAEYARLHSDGRPAVDLRALRSALAERVGRHLGGRG